MTGSVSMTWPQYLRCECAVDGKLRPVTPAQAEMLLVFLLRRGQRVSIFELIEALYPNPFRVPEWAETCIRVQMHRLRHQRGVPGINRAGNDHWMLDRPDAPIRIHFGVTRYNAKAVAPRHMRKAAA